MSAEIALRAAVLEWLRSDAALVQALTGLFDESPLRASEPWLSIGASEAVDWSHKTGTGRDIRLTLNITHRGQSAEQMQDILSLVEDRMAAMPSEQTGIRIVTLNFLRSRVLSSGANRWSASVDYRARVLLS